MKKITSFILVSALCVAATLQSCKKSEEAAPVVTKCATCTATPDAVAANNSSSKGIYKGVFIGSSGTIKFDVLNSGTTITAVMVIDGITVNLNSSIAWANGQPYVAPFTGTFNGAAITINFSVDASGGTPVIVSSSVPGHPTIQFTLLKETSVALVEAFEGSYTTSLSESGTFNMLASRVLGKYGGVSRKTNGSSNGGFDGTLDAAGNMKDSKDGIIIGKITGDDIAGTSTAGNGAVIKIVAKRTL
ncbi:MAG: hypothetical protein ABIN01_06505 [Ferruginibacter sp.]